MLGEFDFQNYTLLIIDDNPNNLGVAVSALESLGFYRPCVAFW